MDSDHSPERIIQDIDKCLLEEEELLAALQQAVRYNNLDEAEAEQILFDFKYAQSVSPALKPQDTAL